MRGIVELLTVLILVSGVACHSGEGVQPSPGLSRGVVPALPGEPPQVLGSIFPAYLCPPEASYAAYGHFVYPPTHPAHPDTQVRPARCFPSEAEATAAGDQIAAAPPGDLVVGEIYLEPTPESIFDICRRAALHLGFEIPCPGMIPFGWSPDGSCAPCIGDFVLTSGFAPTPPGYVGVPNGPGQPQGGHMNIWALPDVRGNEPNKRFCPEGRTRGTFGIAGRRVIWESCPQFSALDSGHVLLWWRDGGAIYGVSLHGHSQLNLEIAKTLVDRIHFISKP